MSDLGTFDITLLENIFQLDLRSLEHQTWRNLWFQNLASEVSDFSTILWTVAN